MEQSTAYLLIFLSPIIILLSKLTVSYRIRYNTIKLDVDKFFKKHKTSFWNRFFYIELKSKIPPILYISNLALGILMILLCSTALVYFALFLFQYQLKIIIIPQIIMHVDVVLTVLLIITGVIEFIDEKIKK